MEENKNVTEEITEETEIDNNKDDKKEEKNDKKSLKKLQGELEDAKKELEKAKETLAEANNKYLTMLAEYDNFRRRSAKEKENSYSDAYADVLSEILPVIDNLERAASYGDGENVAKGLELTLKSFSDIMAKLGVCEIESLGKPFNPEVHNAVMHIDDENFGESEIVEVLQKGYMLKDKVLRYAMVKVAN